MAPVQVSHSIRRKSEEKKNKTNEITIKQMVNNDNVSSSLSSLYTSKQARARARLTQNLFFFFLRMKRHMYACTMNDTKTNAIYDLRAALCNNNNE